jgi:hypothetical protein
MDDSFNQYTFGFDWSATTGPSASDVDTCLEKASTSIPADAKACLAVTELKDATACEAVMLSSDPTEKACSYKSANSQTLPAEVNNPSFEFGLDVSFNVDLALGYKAMFF